MKLVLSALCLSLGLVALCSAAEEQQLSRNLAKANRENVTEEVGLINKSIDEMLNELAIIKREANGRLTKVRSSLAVAATGAEQAERIRQTKVSKFVLSRIAELERESLSMKDVLSKMLGNSVSMYFQEDHDFEEPAGSLTTARAAPSTTTSAQPAGMPATTLAPLLEEEQKIGFDLEALKRLGEEIGKRLDQFGKDTAKNLGDLLEGVKLVFREPNSTTTTTQRPN